MFTKEDIFNELMASNGRMLNSQLVLRFARYLKNPATKEEAKAKFKDYVNKLATLVTDPQNGDKFVVLRPELREQGRRQPMAAMIGGDQVLQLNQGHFIPLPQLSGHRMRGAYHNIRSAAGPQSAMPQQPPRVPPHTQAQNLQQQHPSHSKGSGHQGPAGPPPGRPARAPPAYQQAVSSSKLTRTPGTIGAGPPLPVQPHPNNQNIPPHHPLRGRPSSLKLVHSDHGSLGHIDTLGSSFGVDGPTPPKPVLTPPGSSCGLSSGHMGQHQRRSSAGMINTQLLQQSGMLIPKGSVTGGPPPPPPLRNLSKSVPSLIGNGAHVGDTDLDCPPAVPSRSRRHSTKGTVVEEKVKQFAEKEFIKDEIRPTLVEKTSVAVSPGTVKEKVQMLKMTSEGNLTAPAPQPHQMLLRSAQMQKDAGSGASGSRRALSSRNSNHDADDKCSVSTLDPLRREFCRKAMTCDYQAMQKMLQEDSSLARAIDYVLGYNALHWAAKYGNCDIVKLIAGTYNVDPNIRTRGAGQTPLHIAYMFNQKAIIDLLIMTYGAQKDIRDFSGRRPDFYGNQKNVETLRSKIYHTEKDKGKEDRAKEISSKRHHRWPIWPNKDDHNAVAQNQMTKNRLLTRQIYDTGAITGRVKSHRNLFDRLRNAQDDICGGDKWGQFGSRWRKWQELRSISLIESNKLENFKNKHHRQQRKQPNQQMYKRDQQRAIELDDSIRTDQSSLSSFVETSSIEQHEDAEVTSYFSEMVERSSSSPEFFTSNSNISI
ncbi:uncharacterized protein LOC111244521 isoform X2 [Varroa destructor]|nr:uncharacterized protein LOC111244521 isoform X2 [Varroa destructor]